MLEDGSGNLVFRGRITPAGADRAIMRQNRSWLRCCSWLSGEVDIDDMRVRIKKIILEMWDSDNSPDIGGEDGDPSHCMSSVLSAHMGSYVVIGGVFNYWNFDQASEFVKKLSDEFGVHVMHMAWDEESDEIQCQVWLCGRPLIDVNEDPIRSVLRRVI